jgi:hypothetical protein
VFEVLFNKQEQNEGLGKVCTQDIALRGVAQATYICSLSPYTFLKSCTSSSTTIDFPVK